MTLRRILTMMATVVALIVGTALAGTASAAPAPGPQSAYAKQAVEAGLTVTQADGLQQRVDRYLSEHPEWRQVAANKIATDGGSLTVAVPGEERARDLSASSENSLLACNHGHLCITDGYGGYWDYYYCGRYEFWGIGDGTFNNNQTSGTVARFYNQNGSLRWTNTAKDTGTASWTPVYYIRPC